MRVQRIIFFFVNIVVSSYALVPKNRGACGDYDKNKYKIRRAHEIFSQINIKTGAKHIDYSL